MSKISGCGVVGFRVVGILGFAVQGFEVGSRACCLSQGGSKEDSDNSDLWDFSPATCI